MNTANQCIFSLNFCHGNLKNRMRMDWGMVVTRLANLDCLQPLTSYSYHPHYRMTKNIYSFIICHRCMCILYVCMPLQYFYDTSHSRIPEVWRREKKKINQPPSPKEITQKCNALQDCTEILQITENKVIKTREGHTLISMTSWMLPLKRLIWVFNPLLLQVISEAMI